MSSKNKLGRGRIGLLLLVFLLFGFAVDAAAQCSCAKKRHVAHHRHAVHHTNYTARQTYHPPRTTYITYPAAAAAAQPAPYAPASTARTTKNYREYDADYFDPRRIGHDFGFRDGYKRGLKVGMSRKNYYPEKNNHYMHPTNGYKSRYGSKTVYREGYRDGYLKGYHAGFWSIAGSNSVGQRVNY